MESKPQQKESPFQSVGRSRKGEPWVWLTAAGLSFGIAMALGLLLLISFKGLSSFWPRKIDLMEVQRDGQVERVAGYIAQTSLRRDGEGGEHEQIQIFRGNKDLFGQAFLFIDREQIKNSTRPENLMLVERIEFGPVIFEPVALVSGGKRIEASDPQFAAFLKQAVKKSDSVRRKTLHIERKQIGKNSLRMEALLMADKAGEIAQQDLQTQRAELQREFDRLQQEAAAERAKIQGDVFIGKVIGRNQLEVPVEDLIGVFESNRAGWLQRLGEMSRRIWRFLTDEPREANTEGGVFPAIFGTVVMTLVMTLFVTPLGVIAAIYLREYAKQGILVKIVRICVNNLAGVPSIVFGVFGLAFFVYFVGKRIDLWFYADKLPTPTFGTPGILWASLTLAILTLPVMIVATEEALSAVPRGVREAALACGASKWQAIQRIVIPASLPGILTGVILAMARGAGEVAPLMLVGVVKLAPSLPVDDIAPFIHAERKFMHLGFHIYDLGFQSPDAEAAKPMVYATALLLILIVLILNLAAIIIRNRLKKRFAVSHF